jgi:hypothetical protein
LDVDSGSRLREWGQIRSHHYGSGVPNLHGAWIHLNAHAIQEVGQRLGREKGLALIARSIQAYNQSVSKQLVLSHSFDGSEFFHPHARLAWQCGGIAQ